MSYVQYFCSQSLVEHVLPVGEVPGRVRPPTPLVRDPYNPGFNVAETLPYFAANTSSGCEASAWPSAATEVRNATNVRQSTHDGSWPVASHLRTADTSVEDERNKHSCCCGCCFNKTMTMDITVYNIWIIHA